MKTFVKVLVGLLMITSILADDVQGYVSLRHLGPVAVSSKGHPDSKLFESLSSVLERSWGELKLDSAPAPKSPEIFLRLELETTRIGSDPKSMVTYSLALRAYTRVRLESEKGRFAYASIWNSKMKLGQSEVRLLESKLTALIKPLAVEFHERYLADNG